VTSLEPATPPSSSALTARLASADAHVAQFSGTLADLSVADLIQILQLAGKSAAVVVTHESSESRLWCVAGEIVDAESGRLRGEAAVHRILALEHGWLRAELRAQLRTRSIFAAVQRLLLEAARRKDESVALRQRLGDPQRCYRLAAGLAPDQLRLGALELCLLRSFADARTLAEVFESSELGDFETLTALCGWLEAGHLVEAGLRPTLPAPAAVAIAAASPDALGTLRPLVASTGTRPPLANQRTRPASRNRPGAVLRVWGIIAALLLTPAGYLTGSQTRHSLEPDPAPSLLAVAAAAAPVEAAPSFDLELRVEPPRATIWLDGERAGVGQLDTQLARDGVAHELRVTAPGFLPLRILFVDTPPPLELELEPLPAPEQQAAIAAQSAPGVAATALALASPAASGAAKARKRPATARAPLRREATRPGPRARPHAAAPGLREASARQNAASSADDSIIRVLD